MNKNVSIASSSEIPKEKLARNLNSNERQMIAMEWMSKW